MYSAGSFLTDILSIIIGTILYIVLIPKKEKKDSNKKYDFRFLYQNLGSLFVLIGFANILTYCFHIDDLNFLNGTGLVLCGLALEYCYCKCVIMIRDYVRSKKSNKDIEIEEK